MVFSGLRTLACPPDLSQSPATQRPIRQLPQSKTLLHPPTTMPRAPKMLRRPRTTQMSRSSQSLLMALPALQLNDSSPNFPYKHYGRPHVRPETVFVTPNRLTTSMACSSSRLCLPVPLHFPTAARPTHDCSQHRSRAYPRHSRSLILELPRGCVSSSFDDLIRASGALRASSMTWLF